ncbi:MAG: regulator of sirC expression with transglutaminase-like and TPR domain [Vicingaceae bacterium]|jgi:regulator of sirC expression with transglutaminase-like and TPR domain
MKDASRISALINLLDDPDETIFSQVSLELLGFGDQVVRELEDAWENSFNEILQLRIESIIHQIQFQEVKNRLTDWKNGETHSLVEAAIILTHYQYSELDEVAIRQTVDDLYKQCWLEMNPDYTALEKVGVLNKVFFELNGFSGNKEDYNAPRKSYINNVLQSKKGNPISICMLYLELAERLRLPIYGVNLPEHFVVAYLMLPLQYLETVDDESVLFYIDPFNKGSLFQRSDIENYLKKLKIDQQEKFFMPCEKMTVVNRMINNLMYGYNKNGQLTKVEELKILKNCLK